MIKTSVQGARIAALRARQHLSQEALAARAELSQPTLSRIEKGQRRATYGELIPLSWALGCPIATLLDEVPLEGRVRFAARSRDDEATLTPLKEYLQFLLVVSGELEDQKTGLFE